MPGRIDIYRGAELLGSIPAHACTDATLAMTGLPGVYVCRECGQAHESGRDIRRCHGCYKLFPVASLTPAQVACSGEFCSPACDEATAKLEGRRQSDGQGSEPRAVREVLCEGCRDTFLTLDPRKIHCSKRCAKRVNARRAGARKREERKAQAL